MVVVDSLTACLKEGGEIVQAGLGPEQLVEIGELVMLKHAAASKRSSSASRTNTNSSSTSSSSRTTSGRSVKEKEKEKEKHGHHGLLHHLPSFKKEKDKDQEVGPATQKSTESNNLPHHQNGDAHSLSENSTGSSTKETPSMKGVVEMCKAEEKAAAGMETELQKDEAIDGLIAWLTKGNVIYKSVGLGLMDVVVGGDLVGLAEERRIGTRIEDF